MPATVLWTLVKDSHQISAVMRPLNDVGGELLFALDGDVYFSKTFPDSWTLVEAATRMRNDIEAQGWSVPDVAAE